MPLPCAPSFPLPFLRRARAPRLPSARGLARDARSLDRDSAASDVQPTRALPENILRTRSSTDSTTEGRVENSTTFELLWKTVDILDIFTRRNERKQLVDLGITFVTFCVEILT